MIFGPLHVTEFRKPPYIIVNRDERGWYAAMCRANGKQFDRLPDSHVNRRDAMDEARDWARDEGVRLHTGSAS